VNKIKRYFPNTDLRCGHDGLFKLAVQKGCSPNSLGKGEFLAFVNRKQTSIKLYASGEVIAYLRLTKGRLDPKVIQHLPEYFDGTQIHYDKAMVSVFNKQFPKWFSVRGFTAVDRTQVLMKDM
jgi:hypothetical protein